MICDKCKGKGYITNPKLYQVPSWRAYEMGYCNPIKCRKCGGSGFILGNAKDVMEMLNVSINTNTPLTMREIKQLKLLLQK